MASTNPPRAKIALCLPGGGATGAMFQIGALAAFEDAVEGVEVNGFDFYVGSSGGASVAAALAGGLPVQRIYRAFLDPADVYFGLERKHLFKHCVAQPPPRTYAGLVRITINQSEKPFQTR